MLHKSIVRELEKNGFTVETDLTNKRDLESFICKNNEYIMTWWSDKGVVSSIHVKRLDQEDNIYTDYFPGTFHHSIKNALRHFQR